MRKKNIKDTRTHKILGKKRYNIKTSLEHRSKLKVNQISTKTPFENMVAKEILSHVTK